MKHNILVLLVLALFTAFINNGSLFAKVAAKESADATEAALELTPVNRRLSLSAGETKTEQLTVKNLNRESISIAVYAVPFSSGNNGKTQDLETETGYTAISHWILFLNEQGEYMEKATFTITGHESKELTYSINVPQNAPGGGQYCAVIVEILPAFNNQGSIHTISRAAMVIYASVSGDIIRKAEIKDIKTEVAAIGKDIGLVYSVENQGNIELQSSAEIAVYSFLGKELYRDTSITAIFPEKTETIVVEWDNSPSFGIFKLDYTIAALDNVVSRSSYILVVTPIALSLLVILFASMIVVIVYSARKRGQLKHSKIAETPREID